MKFIYQKSFQEAKKQAIFQLVTIWKRISFLSIFVSLILSIFLFFFSHNILLISILVVLIFICVIASINSYLTSRKLTVEKDKLSLEHSLELEEKNLIIVEENIKVISLEYSKIHTIYREKIGKILKKQTGKFNDLIKDKIGDDEAIIIIGDFNDYKLKINNLFRIKSLAKYIIIIPEKINVFEKELLNKTEINSIQKLTL